MTDISVYDHYRTVGGDHADGTYRVVGVGDERVRLLRVGEPNGRRTNTGEVITVAREDLDGFEPAENPDSGRPLRDSITSVPGTAYWSLRVFLGQLTAHPVPTAVGSGLVAIGYTGAGVSPISDTVSGALILVGSLSLFYIGSGRL